MIRILFYVLSGWILLLNLACSQENDRSILNGPGVYGDTATLSLPEAIPSLHPLYNTDLYTHRILCNIFEPLFDINTKNGKIEPRIAESFEWKNKGTTLKINLRKGILFHDDACFTSGDNEMTAEDVKFTMEMACSKSEINQSNDALIGRIQGANSFFSQKKKSVAGIRIINSHCLEIDLNGKYTHLPIMLTSSKYGICSKIAHSYYRDKIINHPIGTGPFKLIAKSKKEILLGFHSRYWREDRYGNSLPYLNAIRYKITPNEADIVSDFKKQQIDLISELSPQNIDDILFSLKEVHTVKPFPHRVLVIPGSRSSMIVLNQEFDCFKDARVRKAIDLIIDREYIANEIMNGDGIPANKGFAPMASYYNNRELPAKKVNKELAKQLFQSTVYGHGKPFPTLKFYVAGNNASQVAIYCGYIAKELKAVLNINTRIYIVDNNARVKAVKSKEAALWKLGWSPDYPDPEAYFSLFYSKNPTDRSQNPLLPKVNSTIYDFNYSLGMQEPDKKLRNNYFTNCDQILQEDCWVLPILYEDFVFVTNLRLRAVNITPIGLIDFTYSYIKPL